MKLQGFLFQEASDAPEGGDGGAPPAGDGQATNTPSLGIDYTGMTDPPEGGDGGKDKSPSDGKDKPPSDGKDKPKPGKPRRSVKLSDDALLELEDDGSDTIDLSKMTFKRKVNGKEVDVSIGSLAKDWELRSASYDRHEKLHAREQAFQRAIEAMREDETGEHTANFFREYIGKDPDEWAESRLAERIRLDHLLESGNKEEWQKRERERLKSQIEREQRAEQQQRERVETEKRQKAAQARYFESIKQERERLRLDDSIGLGALMLMENRFQRMGRDPQEQHQQLASEAADLVRADLEKRIRGMDDDSLFELLGPAVVSRFNKYLIKKVSNAPAKPKPKPKEEPPAKPSPSGKRIIRSEREILENLRKGKK